jgi:hypothetical protein
MPTQTFGLLFFRDRPQGSDAPGFPKAHVYIKGVTIQGYRGLDEGSGLITPQCVTYQELAHWIDNLKAELDAVRREAQSKFVSP